MEKISFWTTISAYLLRPFKRLTAKRQQPVLDVPNVVPVEPPAPVAAPASEHERSDAIAAQRHASHAGDGARTHPPESFRLKAAAENYEAWLEVNRWNERRRQVLQAKIDQLKRRPLFSVIMPVWNPPIAFFELALESLSRQVYPDWELCIVDDASTDPAVKAMIRQWMKKDGRIRAEFNDHNGHISAASNRAAAMASGEYLVFLDQDDELTPNALGELAAYVNEHSDADVIYSDDDKIDAEGRRFDPQFKPDWSPELLLSFMYFSHMFVVRTALFRKTGGMRLGFEGSQDYDLALRATEKARHIGHIPLVLYHWRVHPGSTASSGAAKPSSFEAGRRAVQEAFDRRGVRARVIQPNWAVKAACGIYSPVFPDEGPKVAILIATKNRFEILKKCLESLERTSYRNYEIVIIDNGSDDAETIRYLSSLRHRVLAIPNPNGKFNYAYIHNEAVKKIDSEYVLFLNNDTEVLKPEWLSQMVGYAHRKGAGAVGARLLFPDGRIQHAGITHGLYKGMAGPSFKLLPSWNNGYMSLAKVNRNCIAVTAACLLTPRELFKRLGGFDDRAFAVSYNDVDYCYRLREAGYRIVYCADAELAHCEGYSRGFVDNPAEGAAFRGKYSDLTDPYYNGNLSLDNEKFEVRSQTVFRDRIAPIRAFMCAYNMNWEGSSYSQYELTASLKERGIIEPIVYSAQDGPLRQAYESKGIRVEVFPHPLSGLFGEESYDAAIDRFADWIKSWNVELVYANTLQTFYAIDAANRLNVPSVWNPRESEPWQSYFDHFGPDIARRALGCFEYPYRVVFVADASRNGFAPLDTRLNFGTIHNGLDRSRLFTAIRADERSLRRSSMGIANEEHVVLLLGTVCERKGQLDLVEAASRMSPEIISKCRFLIVGDRSGEYSERLHRRIAELPFDIRDRIRVVPETSEAPAYFSIADLFVCASRIESFPRVILEAMASGLPIVTTSVFGIAEQVQDGVNGLFYTPGDSERLARHIEALVQNPDMRRSMGQNSRYVLDLINDYEAMTTAYGKVFREAWLSGEARRCAESRG